MAIITPCAEYGTPHKCYACACYEAAEGQGINALVSALAVRGIDATIEQTGGFTMVAYVYGVGGRAIGGNEEGAAFVADIDGDDLHETWLGGADTPAGIADIIARSLSLLAPMTTATFDAFMGEGRTAFIFRTLAEAVACSDRRRTAGFERVEVAEVVDDSGEVRYCVAFAPMPLAVRA